MSSTQDTNWRSYTGINPDTSGFTNPPDPHNYDDILKFSDCTNALVENKTISSGKENCVDAVRGSNYQWVNCQLESGAGISSVTIKGAIDGWKFIQCKIGKGKQTDIELGQFDNYWYIGRTPTKNGLIKDCQSLDGSKIRVTCWNSDCPIIENSQVSIIKVPWIIWFPYFCFRYIQTHWFAKKSK
jgi:hypothetical protein